MSDAPDAASILFPNDVPKPAQMPEWAQLQRNAAEQRLAGSGHGTKPDAAAAAMFPSEAPKAEQAQSPAGDDADDPAAKLFGSDADKPDYDNIVSGELDQYTLGAIQDGDEDRADALRTATSALAADFRAAGTDAEDLKDAFAIVRQSAGVVPPTIEQSEAAFAAGMAAISQAGIPDSDLNAARAFIRDLETVSPGVVASLEAHGAGNDPRLIRAAIKEAKRRGYR